MSECELLETTRNPDEGRETFLARWTNELRDLWLTVDVTRSSLALNTHVIDRARARIKHLTVTQLETEVAVDVDGGCLAGDLTLET